MTGLVWLGYVPAGLVATALAFRVLRRRLRVWAAAENQDQLYWEAEAEQHRFDAEFLDIVTTQLADLEVRRPQDE